jgi:hypothetical protein
MMIGNDADNGQYTNLRGYLGNFDILHEQREKGRPGLELD